MGVALWSADRLPLGHLREQPQHLDVVPGVKSEPVVDTRRQVDEVTLLQVKADPLVILVPDLKVSAAGSDQPDLLIFVKVFRIECLQLFVRGVVIIPFPPPPEFRTQMVPSRRNLLGIKKV